VNLPFLIARRYFFSRKQKTVINIISWISLVGIGVSTAALIIVLSVYNGIGALTQGLFNSFDPELVVRPAKGKTFSTADMPYRRLCGMEGVAAVSQIAEEDAWITFRHNEAIVSLRGVDDNYPRVSGLDTLLYEGDYCLRRGGARLLFGAEVFYNLGLSAETQTPVAVHIPKRGTAIGMTMEEAFNTGYALPGGNFYIQQDIDTRYVVADIAFVRELMDYAPGECTSLAIALRPGAKAARVKDDVRELLGDRFVVLDRFEQQPIYYKVFRSERLGIYLILALIVLISTLNLVASLTLLVLDKRRDTATLRSLGMLPADICRAFRIEGVMIASVGVAAGLLAGFAVCFLQQQFGIVKMGDNFVVSAFPVLMRGVDFLCTFVLVMVISTASVFLAVRKAKC